jgi:hypothetical protein
MTDSRKLEPEGPSQTRKGPPNDAPPRGISAGPIISIVKAALLMLRQLLRR